MDKLIYLFLIKKKGTQIDKFYEMFTNKNEISLKEIKNFIAKSTFHEILKKEIAGINMTLDELNEKIKLFEFSLIDKNGTTYKAIKKYPEMIIMPTTNYFALKIQREIENG